MPTSMPVPAWSASAPDGPRRQRLTCAGALAEVWAAPRAGSPGRTVGNRQVSVGLVWGNRRVEMPGSWYTGPEAPCLGTVRVETVC